MDEYARVCLEKATWPLCGEENGNALDDDSLDEGGGRRDMERFGINPEAGRTRQLMI